MRDSGETTAQRGYGIKVFAKGDRHEGYYSNDKRNGFGTYYWANG